MSDQSLSSRYRIGAVPYLNAWPLIDALRDPDRGVNITLDTPSRLTPRLLAGAFHAALVPSFDFLLHDRLVLLPDLCIGCHGPVESVRLFCRVPMDAVQTVVADAASRTSVALVRVLFAERHQRKVEVTSADDPLASAGADAVLFIGDRAMRGIKAVEVMDLGAAWVELTGLPFIFAGWTFREGTDLGDLPHLLRAARDEGLQHIPDLAARAETELGFPRAQAERYLSSAIDYMLTDNHRKGLERFAELCARHHLLPRIPRVRLYEPQYA